MISIQRVLNLEKIPQEAEDHSIEVDDSWPQHGEIVFENVELRYRPDRDLVLHDLTFTVKPRQKVGICGRTGAGKSTIALTLSRIVELEKGRILIDGVDIRKIDI